MIVVPCAVPHPLFVMYVRTYARVKRAERETERGLATNFNLLIPLTVHVQGAPEVRANWAERVS